MKRGQETLMPNWALMESRRLRDASGRILEILAERANYRLSTLRLGEIMDATGYGERTVQKGLAKLRDLGFILSDGEGSHVLTGAASNWRPRVHKACASSVQSLRTGVHPSEALEPLQERENEALNKGNKGNKGNKDQTTGETLAEVGAAFAAPVVETAREEAWDDADAALFGEPEGGNSTAADAAPMASDLSPSPALNDTPANADQAEPTKGKKVPGRAARREPTGFQLAFEQLAVACYGGMDGLTNEARSRIGKAAKSLLAAGYTPEDVPRIAAWIRANEPWRTGTLAPQTIAERAPAWRAGERGNLRLAPKPSGDATAETLSARYGGL